MGIRWSNIKVLLSPISNEIFLGKYNSSRMMATDRSEDISEQVKAIMMLHMENICKDNNWEACEFESEAGYLRFFRKEEEVKKNEQCKNN